MFCSLAQHRKNIQRRRVCVKFTCSEIHQNKTKWGAARTPNPVLKTLKFKFHLKSLWLFLKEVIAVTHGHQHANTAANGIKDVLFI